MRLRSGSVRSRIATLLLVPLVSLTALWGLSVYVTGEEAWGLLQVKSAYDHFGEPVDDVVLALQKERTATARFLGAPDHGRYASELHDARQNTKRQVRQMRSAMGDQDERDALSDEQLHKVKAMTSAVRELPSLRHKISAQRVSWSTALRHYNTVIDHSSLLYSALITIQNGELARESKILIEVTRGREMLAREHALMSLMLASGKPTHHQYRSFAAASGSQRMLYHAHIPELPAADRANFQRFFRGELASRAKRLEKTALNHDRSQLSRRVDATSWRKTYDRLLSRVHVVHETAGERSVDRSMPYGVHVMIKVAVAGGLGLLALIASIWVSVRVGRRLVGELTDLRDSARNLAESRLPTVMRRLRAGETVDTEAENPPLPVTGESETAQLAEAFNTVQQAAVGAAVEEAELRHGMSAVFVNLARRNQTLLHRQLGLLDTLERRTDDPDELEQLFRLDHMTTRMRRHSEGLIILSGAAPGRAWSNPVRLLDVVRAAVAEVEDYGRVRIRQLPEDTALSGRIVADLTHLLAELVENGTVFSPPHTQLDMHGETVGNGVVLEIDDRGLGMDAQALNRANRLLTDVPEFDPTESDRLGLFVVARLAQRHGVRVTLRPSPYGGTTAVVLVPDTLLATGQQDAQADVAAGSLTGRDNPPMEHGRAEISARQRRSLPRQHAAPAHPEQGDQDPTAHQADSDPGGPNAVTAEAAASDSAGLAPGNTHPESLPSRPARSDPRPTPPDAPSSTQPTSPPSSTAGRAQDAAGAASGTASPGTEFPGVESPGAEPPGKLPRRVRNRSLAPQLRQPAQPEEQAAPRQTDTRHDLSDTRQTREEATRPDPEEATSGPHTAPHEGRERSPEEIRATMSSFQRGFADGRRSDPAEAGHPADEGHPASESGHPAQPYTDSHDTARGRDGR